MQNSNSTSDESRKPAIRRGIASPRNLAAGLGNPAGAMDATDRVPLDEPLFTAVEVGELLRINKSSVHYLKDQGALPFLRIGNRIRFSKRDLETYLARCRCGASEGNR